MKDPARHSRHPAAVDKEAVTGPETEAWFRSLLDTALDGIIVTDDRGRILTFNKACESMFGYRADEMLGKTIDKVMPRGEATHHGDHIDRYIRTGEKRIIGIGRELSARHRDGSEFPIELSIGETRTVSGRQFIGIIRDISARKETEARLRQLQAEHEHLARISAMNELGAAIAHELNQPLTANLLYVQAAIHQLEKAGIKNSAITASLQKAAREAARAGKIMRRMRRFVEKRETRQQRIEIVSVLDEAVEFLRHSMQDLNIHLTLDYRSGPVHVMADPVQIQQIIVNLIRNAMDAVGGQEDRQIRLATICRDKWLEILLEDSGVGISGEISTQMFQAFATTKQGGMGLGLAISRSIARQHGGDLTGAMREDGKGARFVLTLPLPGDDERE